MCRFHIFYLLYDVRILKCIFNTMLLFVVSFHSVFNFLRVHLMVNTKMLSN